MKLFRRRRSKRAPTLSDLIDELLAGRSVHPAGSLSDMRLTGWQISRDRGRISIGLEFAPVDTDECTCVAGICQLHDVRMRSRDE